MFPNLDEELSLVVVFLYWIVVPLVALLQNDLCTGWRFFYFLEFLGQFFNLNRPQIFAVADQSSRVVLASLTDILQDYVRGLAQILVMVSD